MTTFMFVCLMLTIAAFGSATAYALIQINATLTDVVDLLVTKETQLAIEDAIREQTQKNYVEDRKNKKLKSN